MNILGLVFSILLILSYGFYAIWDKQTASWRLRNTYIAHQEANRKILNSYESKVYDKLPSTQAPLKPGQEEHSDDDLEEESSSPKKAPKPKLNRACSKINLFPLIQEGRENHPDIYELAAKLIRTYYGALSKGEKRFEYHFLDLFLASAKAFMQEEETFSLEKITLLKPERQKTYYKMLKGTKKWDLANEIGYPPLQDYIKVSKQPDKICLHHAHPDLLTVLFNSKIASKLFEEIHHEDPPALTLELIEKVCNEAHYIGLDRTFITNFLELGYPRHEEPSKGFIAEDKNGNVLLRKNLYLDG